MAALRSRTGNYHRQEAPKATATFYDFLFVLWLERFVQIVFGFFPRRGSRKLCLLEYSQFGHLYIEVEFLTDARKDRGRLGHAPGAEFATSHWPLVRIHNCNAGLA